MQEENLEKVQEEKETAVPSEPPETFIFKDGQPVTEPPTDGVYEIHQGEGRLVVTYKEGKKNGETVVSDADNKVIRRLHYQDDHLHGQLTTYLDDGQTIDTTMTYKNDVLEGPMVGYYPSGAKRLEGTYAKGKLEGDFIFYSEAGDVCQKTTYKDGLQQGVSTTYFPKSQGGGVCQTSHYDKGLLVQNLERFYATGELLERTPYQNGKPTADLVLLKKDGTPLANKT